MFYVCVDEFSYIYLDIYLDGSHPLKPTRSLPGFYIIDYNFL